MNNIIEVLLRSIAAVVIGTLIGSERMRHGRAAGYANAYFSLPRLLYDEYDKYVCREYVRQ